MTAGISAQGLRQHNGRGGGSRTPILVVLPPLPEQGVSVRLSSQKGAGGGPGTDSQLGLAEQNCGSALALEPWFLAL